MTTQTPIPAGSGVCFDHAFCEGAEGCLVLLCPAECPDSSGERSACPHGKDLCPEHVAECRECIDEMRYEATGRYWR